MRNEQTTLTAPDIVCDGRPNAIRNALGRVEGVSRVEVDVDAKQVSVEHETSVTRDEIVKVLDDAGFSAA